MKFSRYIFILSFFLLIIILSGCAATRINIAPVGPQNIYDNSKYAHIKVYYATDRGYENKSKKKKEELIYTSSRSSELKYGSCEVYIPISLESKEVFYPTFWRLDFVEDPTHLMEISKIEKVDKKEFYNELSSNIANTPDKKAFLFIHGFNTTFDDAAKRTAQIAYNLGDDVVPIFYSWPSMGTLLGYLADEDSVEWTRPHLKQFLDEVATYSGAKTIYLMAHSMGNRALTKALMTNSNDKKKILSSSYSSIMMAAADIDQDVFKRDIAPVLKLTGASITIYASANDNALKASRGLHNDKRVGEIEGDVPVIINGMETIDVSGIDSSFTGHGYYFNNLSFLNDLAQIIKGGKNADARPNLQPISVGGVERYWKLLNVK